MGREGLELLHFDMLKRFCIDNYCGTAGHIIDDQSVEKSGMEFYQRALKCPDLGFIMTNRVIADDANDNFDQEICFFTQIFGDAWLGICEESSKFDDPDFLLAKKTETGYCFRFGDVQDYLRSFESVSTCR